MIIRDKDSVTIFIEQGRELRMTPQEFEDLEWLIKNPSPLIEIKNPAKAWSPCSGDDCTHPSHTSKSEHRWEYRGKVGPKFWRTCLVCGYSQSDVIDVSEGGFTKKPESSCKTLKRRGPEEWE